MSMYGLLHGENSDADLLLAALGLTRNDVGRYRDAWVSEKGEIAVYTRNGGGNRQCWHEDSPEYGSAECENEPYPKTVREYERRPLSTRECGCEGGPTYLGAPTTHDHPTGRMVEETRYRCLKPDSDGCACPGCTIQYRLRKHPLYVTDRDDEFDSTYATIFFRAPDAIPADYPRGESGDERWAKTLEMIRRATKAPR